MFERYTEKARRTIFFARHEASNFGSPFIETEHLLLGLLHEDQALTKRLLDSHASIASIRGQIEQHTPAREKISTPVDLPLTQESRRVLAYAAEEANLLKHDHIGTEHLVLGLLREDKSLAAKILTGHGTNLKAMRKELRHTVPPQDLPKPGPPRHIGSLKIWTTLGRFELALKVADVSVSLAFYMKLGFHCAGGDPKDGVVFVQNGDCRIALHQGQITENSLNFRGKDVSVIAGQLQAAGVEFAKPPFTGPDGGTALLVHDPDGNAIYLDSHPGD
jgi:hypothetical protein